MTALEGRVAALRVHPVKGCRAIALDEAELGPCGLLFDRHWMVVRPDGRFLTQRELPALATIGTALAGGMLTLELGTGVLRIPCDGVGERLRVRVWEDEVDAEGQGSAVDAAFSERLGRPVRLVRFAPSAVRPCDPTCTADGAQTEFADGFPLLVTTTASLAALNDALAARGEEPVPMSRFRPNLVIDGVPAWTEDRARELRVGEVVLDLVKPCERCSVTTTDQRTGERHGREPLATLLAMGRRAQDGAPTFGWNAVPRLKPGRRTILRVGDPVHLS